MKLRNRASYPPVLIVVVALLLGVTVLVHPNDTTTRIVVFTPTTEGNSYWPQVYSVMESAAEDLGVELLGFEFDVGDRFAKITEGVEILRNTPDIDGAIFSVAFGQAEILLQEAERQGFPAMLQGPLFESETIELGNEPRSRYSSWIGLFEQNEYRKGYELGRLLCEAALDRNLNDREEPLEVVALGGDPSWQGSEERAAGLRQAVADVDRARLRQVVPTNWTVSQAQRLTRGLLDRYPAASVLWAASDQLAVGASEVIRESGRRIGEEMVVGGLDLSTEGLRAVVDGDLTATVSSWPLSYAQVLVYLYDYLHGFDFAPDEGVNIVFEVYQATIDTAPIFLDIYASLSEMDFSMFSKARNPELRQYDFSFEAYRSAVTK